MTDRMSPSQDRRSMRSKAAIWMPRLFKATTASLLLSLAFAGTLAMALPGDLVADRVLGQFDFAHSGINILTNIGLNNPDAVAIDRSVVPNRIYVADDVSGNVYVAERLNNRVLEYNNPFTTDTVADLVFGQNGSFTSSSCNLG